MRSNNGGEFNSNELKEFYFAHGIEFQTSWAHTPQQNGLVECKHRHILEVAHALRFQANLPIRFGGRICAHHSLLNQYHPDGTSIRQNIF